MAEKIITPKARLSYPALREARADPQGRMFYSTVLIFEDGTDLSALKAAILAAAQEKWGDKAIAGFKAGKLRSPLRTDGEEKGYPEGSVFFSAKSKTAPGIVGPYAGADGKPQPWTDEIYAGQYARASIQFYPYQKSGNSGVGVGLRNVQILGDGDRIDGRLPAEDEFEATQEAPTDGGMDDIL